MRDAGAYGLQVNGEPGFGFSAVMSRMRRLRAAISHHDSAQRYTAAGIDVFLGIGRFTGPQRLEVEGQILAFAKAVIATGSRAFVPPVCGLDEAGLHYE